ncbi:transposable element Tcb1 transposase [Trichonephila clavipes]|nr:transposable element Tcb1 transposase [Trichonephila clavipes]
MVWTGVSLGYHTDLHIFKRGSVTAVRYRDDVLEPIVRLYAAVVGSTFVLIDNNARPHGADIVDDYLDHCRLTDAEIDKLQRYYGLAVRNNTDIINSMKRAIWATYFHKASTDARPQHGLCPTNKIPGVNITEQLRQVKYINTRTPCHQK